MAISSPLNPQTIVKKRQATMPAAMNFISGGSPMGSSIVSSAANKIVGFQRGTSSVAPRTPDLGSIIKTLSSSILTNVENRIQSINKNVNNVVNQTLKSYGQDYQSKLKQINDTKQKTPDLGPITKTISSSILANVDDKVRSITQNVNNTVNQTLKSYGQDYQSRLKQLDNAQPKNILTDIQDRVQSITQNVNTTVNQTLKSYGEDYQSRLKQIDDAKPNSILSNFLKLYQQAIGYIQFLGNRKNVKTLGDNLQSLQRIFAETFDIAKIVRQTIVKIVKQLSNLPTASTGGGGINLDVNVPGGPLKRGVPKGLTRKMKMMGAGAAVAGGSALAVNAMSSAFDGGGEVQASPGSSSEGLSGPILDRFSAILDRFDAAISSLSKKKITPSTPPSTSSSKSDTTKGDSTAPPPPPGSNSGTAAMPGTDQDLYTLATIASLEGGTAQARTDVGQAVYNRMEKGGKSATQILTAEGQFEPAFTAPYNISGGKVSEDVKKIRTFEDAVKYRMKKTGEKKATAEAQIKSTISSLQNPNLQANSASFIGSRTSFRANANSYGRLSNSVWRGTNADNQYLNEERSKGTATVPTFVSGSGKPGTVVVDTKTPTKPGVVAAPTQSITQQDVAKTVSQPAQQKPQVTVLPMSMDMGSNQTSPKQPSSGGSQPPDINGGRMLQTFSSTNHDNFLTLYSKMVYNIVDG